jgi:methylated-DNA-[protein]-cysteine S-methyltransferase
MLSATLFETPLGACGLAWSERGLVALELPGPDPASTGARLRERVGVDPSEDEPARTLPAPVRDAVDRLRRFLAGAPVALDGLTLDLGRATDFERRVYAALRAVPRGRTCTYGDLASAAGEPRAARAVGRAVGANPLPVLIPCHRVLAAGGRPGGFSAPGGLATKARLLALEGVQLPGREPTLFP